METRTTRLGQFSSQSMSLLPQLSTKTLRFRSKRLAITAAKQSSSSSSSDSSLPPSSSSTVDESMIVLRKRIHQIKMTERNYEPPENWANWEKQHYGEYNEYVCGFVGVLQWILMNTRPSFALAMITLLVMSVPISLVAVALRLVEVANGVFSSLHLS